MSVGIAELEGTTGVYVLGQTAGKGDRSYGGVSYKIHSYFWNSSTNAGLFLPTFEFVADFICTSVFLWKETNWWPTPSKAALD